MSLVFVNYQREGERGHVAGCVRPDKPFALKTSCELWRGGLEKSAAGNMPAEAGRIPALSADVFLSELFITSLLH
jgi:hypothetical protein